MTVYGSGKQTRSYINIKDTVRCIELAILNPSKHGEYRVFNQITEWFSVIELAERVHRIAGEMGLSVELHHLDNPRVESEDHYYNVKHSKLIELGLEPHLLDDSVIRRLIQIALNHRDRINTQQILPSVSWRKTTNQVTPTQPEWA